MACSALPNSRIPNWDMRQVFDLVDRIVVLRRGRIVANLVKDDVQGENVFAYIFGAKSD